MWLKVLKILRNKYTIALIVLVVWISFFDNNDLFTRKSINRNLKELREQRDFYRREIKNDSLIIQGLENDMKMLEKFAREEYNMKKDDEDVFLIQISENDIEK